MDYKHTSVVSASIWFLFVLHSKLRRFGYVIMLSMQWALCNHCCGLDWMRNRGMKHKMNFYEHQLRLHLSSSEAKNDDVQLPLTIWFFLNTLIFAPSDVTAEWSRGVRRRVNGNRKWKWDLPECCEFEPCRRLVSCVWGLLVDGFYHSEIKTNYGIFAIFFIL